MPQTKFETLSWRPNPSPTPSAASTTLIFAGLTRIATTAAIDPIPRTATGRALPPRTGIPGSSGMRWKSVRAKKVLIYRQASPPARRKADAFIASPIVTGDWSSKNGKGWLSRNRTKARSRSQSQATIRSPATATAQVPSRCRPTARSAGWRATSAGSPGSDEPAPDRAEAPTRRPGQGHRPGPASRPRRPLHVTVDDPHEAAMERDAQSDHDRGLGTRQRQAAGGEAVTAHIQDDDPRDGDQHQRGGHPPTLADPDEPGVDPGAARPRGRGGLGAVRGVRRHRTGGFVRGVDREPRQERRASPQEPDPGPPGHDLEGQDQEAAQGGGVNRATLRRDQAVVEQVGRQDRRRGGDGHESTGTTDLPRDRRGDFQVALGPSRRPRDPFQDRADQHDQGHAEEREDTAIPTLRGHGACRAT